jgi:hypothetical protein
MGSLDLSSDSLKINVHILSFDLVSMKFKKNQKNVKPSRCVMLCDLVSMKNNKLGILQPFQKSVH